jgi:hypothetical protein
MSIMFSAVAPPNPIPRIKRGGVVMDTDCSDSGIKFLGESVRHQFSRIQRFSEFDGYRAAQVQ